MACASAAVHGAPSAGRDNILMINLNLTVNCEIFKFEIEVLLKMALLEQYNRQ